MEGGCLFLLNYLLLFTILMIRGNNVRVSIVVYRWLVALEAARGRCECCDCLPTIANAVFLHAWVREGLISRNVLDFMFVCVYTLETSANDRATKKLLTTNLNTAVVAANYQQIVRMICQLRRPIQLMIVL